MRPPSPPSPTLLHNKRLSFTDWELAGDSDDEQQGSAHVPVKNEHQNQGHTAAGLDDAEKEHRRKAKAFEAAARKAQEGGTREDKTETSEKKHSGKEEKSAKQREEEKVTSSLKEPEGPRKPKGPKGPRPKEPEVICLDDDVAEVIDLTGAPSPTPPLRRTVSSIEVVRSSATLQRTTSNPLPEAYRKLKRKRSADVGRHRDAPASSSSGAPSASSAAPAPGVFSGLSFYYLPDSALGARKLRIGKAQQHGAKWVRSLQEATHVIVDKALRWSEVGGAVQDRKADTVLVNENYPLDCIEFRYLLNPNQRRYYISGWSGVEPKRDNLDKKAEATKGKEEGKEGKEGKEKGKENEAETTRGAKYPINPDKHHRRFKTSGLSTEQMVQPRGDGQ